MTKKKKKPLRASHQSRSRRPTGSTATLSPGATLDAVRSEKRARTERHLGMPWTEWQKKKRQEWRTLLDALNRFEWGAAYTPLGTDLFEIRTAANRVKQALAEDWVSW